MAVINKIFTGKLNMDDSINMLDKYDYIDALNITKDAVEGSQDKVVTNIVANRLVDYTLPTGTCIVLGAKADPLRNIVYYFVWNSNSKHSILKYDNSTRTISKLLENMTDTGGTDILAFNRYKRIIHIDIIYREIQGDLLYWVDAVNRPRKINVDTIQSFVPVTESIINAAKNPPTDFLTVAFKDDATVNVNNFRRTLWQFSQSWVYKDGEESSLSPLSKVPLPVNGYDQNTMNDPTKNNNISIFVYAGGKDYQKVKLYGRELLGTTWSDYKLIETFDRDDYPALTPGSAMEYFFYNDGAYPFQDVVRTTQLFDWLPDISNTQALANGNTLVYGGITEGFNNMARADVDVQLTAGIGAPNIPTISYLLSSGSTAIITIGTVITVGCIYSVNITYHSNSILGTVNVSYTTIGGDTQDSIANSLAILINGGNVQATAAIPGIVEVSILGISPVINLMSVSASIAGSENAAASWNWYSKYRFGLVYLNDLGKPISIVSFAGNAVDTNDFAVTTPDFSVISNIIQVPFINASINHTPPVGATNYQWVRTTNLTTDNFLYWVTNDYQDPSDGFLYFCIENLNYQKDKSNGFVPSYEFVKGDHIRVIAKYNAGTVTAYNRQLDFEIVGEVQRTMNTPAATGRFIKVVKPSTLPSLGYTANMIIELYTPALNTIETAQVFYEWDQVYSIFTSGGHRFHEGQLTNQSLTQPATFQWYDGDVYFKNRQFYLTVGSATIDSEFIIDANYNDYFLSKVNSNGRAWVLEPDAKVQYFPTLIRFGQAFQPDTNINGLNRFYYDNSYDKCNRSYGDVLKLSVKGSYLRVGQKFKIGTIPVLLQIVKDSNGANVLATSDQLLNQIVYYEGDYGVGDTPESWVEFNFASYFVYSTRGIICRLSQDGITPISMLYKVNNWSNDHLPLRTGTSTVYGAYDPRSNNYIIALEATSSDSAYTLSFDEESNQFESFLSYHPETICTLGSLMISFKDGKLWTHDSTGYNSFYGTGYESYITAPFNEGIREKKTFTALSEIAVVNGNITGKRLWDCPLIWTNTYSYGAQRQETNLVEAEFEILEGSPSSAIKRDSNSIGGKVNGDFMKGTFIVVKFRRAFTGTFANLAEASVNYISSPLTSK